MKILDIKWMWKACACLGAVAGAVCMVGAFFMQDSWLAWLGCVCIVAGALSCFPSPCVPFNLGLYLIAGYAVLRASVPGHSDLGYVQRSCGVPAKVAQSEDWTALCRAVHAKVGDQYPKPPLKEDISPAEVQALAKRFNLQVDRGTDAVSVAINASDVRNPAKRRRVTVELTSAEGYDRNSVPSHWLVNTLEEAERIAVVTAAVEVLARKATDRPWSEQHL